MFGQQYGSITAQNLNLNSGTPTAGSTIQIDLAPSVNSLVVGIQNTFVATLVVQVSADPPTDPDGQNWITIPNSAYINVATGSSGTLTTDGLWSIPVSGQFARVTCSAYTSGTADVSLVLGISGGSVAAESPLPGAIVAGQQAVTSSATALPSNSLSRGLSIQALTTNAQTVYFGPSGVSTTTGMALAPGQAASVEVDNTSLVYVIASASGSSVTFFGS
jgi:hypothetical protein